VIKRSGGTCIVQDPNEAEYPDMPLSVLNKIEVDQCVSLTEMGTVLQRLMETKEFKETEIPPDIVAEANIAEKVATGIEVVEKVGETSVYTCPDCGGMLTEVKEDKASRYRCHTGHVYSEKDLFLKQTENVESTLWVALRMMEERKNLLVRMENESKQRGFARFANEHRQKGEDLQVHINKLKELLFLTQNSDEN
jgi:two-component system, chemotaxis family, protein-glutamate methylesterase/glutaminase